MRIVIDRYDVQRMVAEEQALIIDAMPKETYDEEHLAGAINIPIKEMNAVTTAHLDRRRPTIVYCWDMQ